MKKILPIALAAMMMTGCGEEAAYPGVQTLSEAEYAEMAAYPEDGSDYEREYLPWSEQNAARRQTGYAFEYPEQFYKNTAEIFLTGAEDNRVISSVNAYMALSMLAEVTDGSSREQILTLLGCESTEKLRTQSGNLWTSLYRNDGATTSILANSLWLDDDFSFKRGTANALSEYYHASSYRGNTADEAFSAALRDWLDTQTGGLLGDTIEGVEFDPETALALCSTVYFRAKWDRTFDPAKNDTKIFHSPSGDTETTFMNGRNEYGVYYAGEDFGAICLQFADGGGMWFILPDEDKTVDDVLRGGEYLEVTKGNWDNQKMLVVNYSVPKFDVSSDIDLGDGLQALGVTDVFGGDADFSPITDDPELFLGAVQHAARVTVDEEGCTAAAFTKIMVAGAALPPEEEMDFVLDRPFLFVITSDTDQPLFTGIVNNP